jgi:hypothetical protein
MTKDDILSMAKEAGATPYTNRHYPDRQTNTFNPDQLERFAALVAEKEREEAEDRVSDLFADMETPYLPDIAIAIRAKGQK